MMKDLPDCGGPDLVPESGELSMAMAKSPLMVRCRSPLVAR